MADTKQALEDLALLIRLSDRMADEGVGSMYHPDTLAQRNIVVRRLREFIERAADVPSSDHGHTEDDLLKALAECRELFPVPQVGHPAEHAWTQAINDPLHVPVFIKAALAHGVNEDQRG